VVFLAASLVGFVLVLMWIGDILAPVLASVVIAYLLDGAVRMLIRFGMARQLAVVLVFVGFILSLMFFVLALIPMLSHQGIELIKQLPGMVEQGKQILMALPEKYPTLFTPFQIEDSMRLFGAQINQFQQRLLSWTVSLGTGMLQAMVYVVLTPMLVFFMLKDKASILAWLKRYTPNNHGLTMQVWIDVDKQVANFIRGKIWEILIVWVISWAVFAYIGLNYAGLLGALSGISALVPYLGAVLATVPVVLVALFQFGLGNEMIYAVSAYTIIQILDGYVLTPLLFSEVVNLHPVAIIVAMVFFGGVWGFWGVFFAIPLATLVQAVLNAWQLHHPAAGGGQDNTG
jgi:putative permease